MTIAAEEELTLLTIEGDLIGRIESLPDSSDPATLIQGYYALLPEEERARTLPLRTRLQGLIPDYEVAFNAADSAEITQVRSDIFDTWASIRTVHAQQFTAEVAALLDQAYRTLYPRILGDP